MRVILLHDVPKFGKRGDVREVSDGYAVNFLIPRKLAETATPQRISALEEQRARMAQHDTENKEAMEELIKKMRGKRFEISVSANEKGRLYEKLTAAKLSALVPEIPIELMRLEEAITEIGERRIPIKFGDISGEVIVSVLKAS